MKLICLLHKKPKRAIKIILLVSKKDLSEELKRKRKLELKDISSYYGNRAVIYYSNRYELKDIALILESHFKHDSSYVVNCKSSTLKNAKEFLFSLISTYPYINGRESEEILEKMVKKYKIKEVLIEELEDLKIVYSDNEKKLTLTI